MHKCLLDLKGLTLTAVKGKGSRVNSRDVPSQYILFNDLKTYIRIDDQDYYSYHDCDSSAKIFVVQEDAEFWAELNTWRDSTDAEVYY
jgi:hypothetical protein